MKPRINVVVVGNCQARPLAKVLESLNRRIKVTGIAIVHLLRSEQYGEYSSVLDEADLIISQLVHDSYPCDFVRTKFLKDRYGSKVISIVNLFFSGYTPDWFYIRIPDRGPLKGPMGDYHNRTIFEAWCTGEQEKTASFRLADKEYNRKYIPDVQKSLQELCSRESEVDVSITDVIMSRYQKERLFFTFNHPAMVLIREYAKRILKEVGIASKKSLFKIRDEEVLDQFIPLTNPATGLPKGGESRHKGVEFTFDKEDLVRVGPRKLYENMEIVERFYSIYKQYGHEFKLDELLRVAK